MFTTTFLTLSKSISYNICLSLVVVNHLIASFVNHCSLVSPLSQDGALALAGDMARFQEILIGVAQQSHIYEKRDFDEMFQVRLEILLLATLLCLRTLFLCVSCAVGRKSNLRVTFGYNRKFWPIFCWSQRPWRRAFYMYPWYHIQNSLVRSHLSVKTRFVVATKLFMIFLSLKAQPSRAKARCGITKSRICVTSSSKLSQRAFARGGCVPRNMKVMRCSCRKSCFCAKDKTLCGVSYFKFFGTLFQNW